MEDAGLLKATLMLEERGKVFPGCLVESPPSRGGEDLSEGGKKKEENLSKLQNLGLRSDPEAEAHDPWGPFQALKFCLKQAERRATMAKKVKMPHPGHEEHLCYLENVGYLRAPELLEMCATRSHKR